MIINEKYFKEYSPIPLNYNMAELNNYISVAEKIWVKPLIGEEFYDELQEEVDDNQISPENATLLTHGGLWQYLAFAAVYEALPMLWGHISEVGITKGKSDNSDSLDLKDMTYISQHLRNQVEVLKDQVKQFICNNQTFYPLANLDSCGCPCDGNKKLNSPNPNKKMYTSIRKNVDLK